MKPFSLDSACVKCGCDEADAKWMQGPVPLDKLKAPELIRRTCSRCGYSWDEAPLDVSLPPTANYTVINGERVYEYPSDEYKHNPKHPHFHCCGKGNFCQKEGDLGTSGPPGQGSTRRFDSPTPSPPSKAAYKDWYVKDQIPRLMGNTPSQPEPTADQIAENQRMAGVRDVDRNEGVPMLGISNPKQYSDHKPTAEGHPPEMRKINFVDRATEGGEQVITDKQLDEWDHKLTYIHHGLHKVECIELVAEVRELRSLLKLCYNGLLYNIEAAEVVKLRKDITAALAGGEDDE